MNRIKQDSDQGMPVQYMDDEFFEDTDSSKTPER
jgi:hypothetical protein